MYEQVTTSISYIIAQNVKNVLVYNTNTPITLTLPDATAYKGREISIARFSDTDLADITIIATGVTVINTKNYLTASIIFNCTVSGNIQFAMGSEIAATTVTLSTGSTLIYKTI